MELGCSRDDAIDELNAMRIENKLLNTVSEMFSEHNLIFTALKKTGMNPKSILEIGTYKAETTLLLHKLFPTSKIDTFDLPLELATDKHFYNYDKPTNDILECRMSNLANTRNVKFHEKSSVQLINSDRIYDLVWIDGSHGYPIVTMDIVNALHLVSNSGWILCDNVFKDLKYSDADKDSVATYKTLLELEKVGAIEVRFFYKRLQPEHLVWRKRTKFIALTRKVVAS